MPTLIQQFKAARNVSTPLIAIRTPDPAATIAGIEKSFNGGAPPMLQWDAVRGLSRLNEAGARALAQIASDGGEQYTDPISTLEVAQKLPADSILFFHNAQRVLDSLGVIQALWNLRDQFKSNFRSVVLLCPDLQLPPELTNDVLVLDEPLPNSDELASIVKDGYEAASLENPIDTVVGNAVDAIAGLAAFPAEQVVMMSLTPNGLDMDALWERKRQTIEQTPGLSVWRGGERFSDIGGIENIKTFLSRVIHGVETPRAIVFIDEIEKALSGAGSHGDSSGVSQDQLGTLLTWMQDNQATGIICIGPPGTSKSMLAKATGTEAGVPTVALDFGAMKGSLVGESEGRLRSALKTIKAMAGQRVFFIATCNSIGVLPPELRRRFTFGSFFFDLPTASERTKIWNLYTDKYNLSPFEVADVEDDGWTGAEIKQCCEIAYRLQCSIGEAASYIVPVSRSAVDQVEHLRMQASGRFISASQTGIYQYDKSTGAARETAQTKAPRAIKMEES